MASIQKYTTKTGTRYCAIIYIGIDPDTGKQINKKGSGFKTKAEANRWAAATKAAFDRGERQHEKERRRLHTMSSIYEEWYQEYALSVKPSTAYKTNQLFETHILPIFGDIPLIKITDTLARNQALKWHAKLKKYDAPRMYAKRLYDWAIERDYTTGKNPFANAKITKKEEPTNLIESSQLIWERDELNTFLEACKKDTRPIIYPFFRLLAYSGMRIGEILALPWENVDLDNQVIEVKQALTTDSNGKTIVGTPKNKKSIRPIPLDPITASTLKEWRHHTTGKGFVFPNQNGKFIIRSRITKWINQITPRAGVHPITPHGFRHTHCTLLFEAGATVKEVQNRLGHESVETTLQIYTHVTAKKQKETAARFADYLE